jgi:F-type H+-transporting ATPase subunit epsilon
MAFHCTLVTPEQQAFDAHVTQAILPAHDGLIGVLTNRAPLLVKLGLGPLRFDLPDGRQLFYLIDGGIAQVKNNKLTILTSDAMPADRIDHAAAEAEYAQALSRPAPDDKSFDDRQKQLARARIKQRLATRVG